MRYHVLRGRRNGSRAALIYGGGQSAKITFGKYFLLSYNVGGRRVIDDEEDFSSSAMYDLHTYWNSIRNRPLLYRKTKISRYALYYIECSVYISMYFDNIDNRHRRYCNKKFERYTQSCVHKKECMA